MDEQLKTVADFTAVTITVASLLSWLPPLAAFVSIVWGCISIYETKTVQNLIKKRKNVNVSEHNKG
jgi:hypothetical protein